ncbi:MAG: prephenate dehydrogenase/arogenate dehydrogenase family protein [Armatimonadetes bacterium]|nr:prephenate dehydrogenase/arogenate dehydrogenase family protein [Armatimonadota bacterium]
MRRVNYGTVGIVGLGLIGGSVGLRLREAGVASRVIGFDTSEEARRTALSRGCVDRTFETLNRLADADILVIAVPPNSVVPCLVDADVFCKVNCIVTDTSSVKAHIVHWTETYPLSFGPRFVGGHPMAGAEKGGPDNARPDLFEGRAWILTPIEKTDRGALEAIKSLVASLGANPIVLSPEEHDRHAAVLSHLPHALAGLLAQLGSNLVHPEAAGPSWHDLTRVAGSDPELWAGIFRTNRAQVVSALEDLEYLLTELKRAVDADQHQALVEFFENSRIAKAGWER